MTPTLQPGDEVVASDSLTPVPGDLVVFEHPQRTGFWMIKRLIDEDGRVLSDNRTVTEADSRTMGPIDVSRMLTVVDQLDEDTFAQACHLLADEDPALAAVIDRWGVPEFWHRAPGFATLVLLVLEQQVSLESGAAMFGRLHGLLGEVSPATVLAAGIGGLRAIGVTRQKADYLTGLALMIQEGIIDLDEIAAAPPSDARQSLMSVKGIGAWTADAYLLSAHRRPDTWPAGDRALQVGAAEVLGMSSVPSPGELELIAEPWRPVRAVAARLIWHSYLSRRGRVEPAPPASARDDAVGA
jgi:DNA-3-methyladenine glycosylase II